ncbi:MAG: 3-phosphoshikimate 1-carboxyvinyltransferase [Candidatus Firestonebacteria bacterium]|nr:3-phosphoshikimate 1-carboxyvinyltransferase [Candidatus Firestonebacteria bacterium]
MSEKFISPVRSLKGELHLPGDKSISHRAAILGLLAEGQTRVYHFLTADDCLNTVKACQQLGAKVEIKGEELNISGCGWVGLRPPKDVIDCGNSGTGVRLLAGVLAGQAFESVITGDEQVQRRPMRRIIDPLKAMGAEITSEPGGLCPLRIRGGNLSSLNYLSPVASAQVKSCLLLAGLYARGRTLVTEPSSSRDHTERLMRYFGIPIRTEGLTVSVEGGVLPQGREITVPADISSAAFFLVAAALLPGSDLRLFNVGMNRTRTGVLEVLRVMEADIAEDNPRTQAGEPVADLAVKYRKRIQGAQIKGAKLIPRLIDELPILAVAAAAAEGETLIAEADELRVKETDRISVLVQELKNIGVAIEERPDGMLIRGGKILGGKADSHGDHRLAMSLAVAGLVSEKGVTLNNPECVRTSYPEFWDHLAAVTL